MLMTVYFYSTGILCNCFGDFMQLCRLYATNQFVPFLILLVIFCRLSYILLLKMYGEEKSIAVSFRKYSKDSWWIAVRELLQHYEEM